MQIKDFLSFHSIRILRDLIAFRFVSIKIQPKSGIIIPESHNDMGLRTSRYYYGQVLAVSEKVTILKKKEFFLFKEYDAEIVPNGSWEEDKIYFISEKAVPLKIKNPSGLLFRKEPKGLEEKD